MEQEGEGMMIESKMYEHNGIYDYVVTIDTQVDFFHQGNPRYIVTLTKQGVLVEPYKEGRE